LCARAQLDREPISSTVRISWNQEIEELDGVQMSAAAAGTLVIARRGHGVGHALTESK
jgi:hypothetical protein